MGAHRGTLDLAACANAAGRFDSWPRCSVGRYGTTYGYVVHGLRMVSAGVFAGEGLAVDTVGGVGWRAVRGAVSRTHERFARGSDRV